jgi:hypothetical protein
MAFRKMGKFSCQGCWTNCYHENNALFSLYPDALFNAFCQV